MQYPEYYKRDIRLPGPAHEQAIARLTYCLGNEASEKGRIFLLTNFHESFTTQPAVRKRWDRLEHEVRQLSTGNFQQDKFLVNQIKDNPGKFPFYRVAVHHFGPVPVMVTDHYYEQELHGEIVSAQVVLYYNHPQAEGNQFSFIFPDKSLFIRSLKGSYSLIMQRYFEDVSQVFFGIAQRSSLVNAYDWSKLIEDYIGSSIQSKIRDSVPKPADWESYLAKRPLKEDIIQTCDLFKAHNYDIFLAQYYRYICLFLLNELYSQLGLGSRSKEYLDKIEELFVDYDRLLGPGTSANLIASYGNASFLTNILKCYQQKDFDRLSELVESTTWRAGLLEFVIFLLNLQLNYVSPQRGRIFISYNHEVKTSELLKEKIEAYYHQHYENSVEILSVHNLPATAIFGDAIRTRIWQSDRVFIIVPKSPAKAGSASEGSYEWLAKEAEHALFLKKRVVFFIEEGFDRDLLIKTLNDENMSFLVAPGSEKEKRLGYLLRDFEKRVHVKFKIPGDTDGAETWQLLIEDVRPHLTEHAEKAVTFRHFDMTKGYLTRFTPDTILFVKAFQSIFEQGVGLKKEDIVTALYQKLGVITHKLNTKSAIRTKFENSIWPALKSRQIIIDGQAYTLLSLKSEGISHHYFFHLSEILCQLQPDLSKERTQAWIERLFNEI